MAQLTNDVMFRTDNTEGYTDIEIAAFNLELQDRLGDLQPGSDAYMERAKVFHDEVARR